MFSSPKRSKTSPEQDEEPVAVEESSGSDDDVMVGLEATKRMIAEKMRENACTGTQVKRVMANLDFLPAQKKKKHVVCRSYAMSELVNLTIKKFSRGI